MDTRAGDSRFLPIEDFRKVFLDVKEKHGWSWQDVADITGRKRSHVSSLGLDRTKKRILKATAEDLLGRLSGASLPPTPLQQAAYTKKARRDQSDQRAETLRDNKMQDRKAAVAKLRGALGPVRLEES